jgi:hypothetical protein
MTPMFKVAFAVAGLAAAFPASAAIIAPSPYLCFDAALAPGCGTADSPFKAKSYSYFHLETFEDTALNTPGVTLGGSNSIFGPTRVTDSVDGDSGPIDGSGNSGRSLGSNGLNFLFSEAVLGQLPTDVGIVITDGGTITVQFFDRNDVLLGSGIFVGDAFSNGTTAEDRFIGWSGTTGVARMRVAGAFNESDHLQYGLFKAPITPPVTSPGVIPEPGAWAMLIAGFGLVGAVARRRRPVAASS